MVSKVRQKINNSEKGLLQQVKIRVAALNRSLASAHYWQTRWTNQVEQTYQKGLAEVEAAQTAAQAEISQRYWQTNAQITVQHEQYTGELETDYQAGLSQTQSRYTELLNQAVQRQARRLRQYDQEYEQKIAQTLTRHAQSLSRAEQNYEAQLAVLEQAHQAALDEIATRYNQLAAQTEGQVTPPPALTPATDTPTTNQLLAQPTRPLELDLEVQLPDLELFEADDKPAVATSSEANLAHCEPNLAQIPISSKEKEGVVLQQTVVARAENNQLLNDLLNAPTWPEASSVLLAWLGQPLNQAEITPLAAIFKQQAGNNLLLIGPDEVAAQGITETALVSLAAQLPPTTTRQDKSPNFYIFDFSAADNHEVNVFEELGKHLPHSLEIYRPRHLPEVLARLVARAQGQGEAEKVERPATFLLLYGLQQAHDLRPEESSGFTTYTSLAEQLAHLLKAGPQAGIHTLLWCDTLANLDKRLERESLGEFKLRITFQGGDKPGPPDSPTSQNSISGCALFQSDSHDQSYQQEFYPYAPPTQEWLHQAGLRLSQKPDLTF